MPPLTFLDPARTAPGHLTRARTRRQTKSRANPALRRDGARALALFQHAVRLLALWREPIRRRRAMRELSALDDHLLNDIGLTRSELVYKASKPLWR